MKQTFISFIRDKNGNTKAFFRYSCRKLNTVIRCEKTFFSDKSNFQYFKMSEEDILTVYKTDYIYTDKDIAYKKTLKELLEEQL